MAQKIKNYTSEVHPNKSIDAIEKVLVNSGVIGISKEYRTVSSYQLTTVVSLKFYIIVNGLNIFINLPANVDKVAEYLWKLKKYPANAKTQSAYDPERKKIWQQAERTAWKNTFEWVSINLSLIAINQLDLIEVFLPYVFDEKSKKTYYNSLKDNGFKFLN